MASITNQSHICYYIYKLLEIVDCNSLIEIFVINCCHSVGYLKSMWLVWKLVRVSHTGYYWSLLLVLLYLLCCNQRNSRYVAYFSIDRLTCYKPAFNIRKYNIVHDILPNFPKLASQQVGVGNRYSCTHIYPINRLIHFLIY